MPTARPIRWDLWVLVLVVAAVVLPYHTLATGTEVLVTDDVFTSDVWSAGIPWRAAAGRSVRAGEWPLWQSGILGGVPASGPAFDPFTLVASALLPPHVAYGLPLLVWLAWMSAGTFLLARRFGAGRTGAALAAVVFPLSGAVVTHFKHLEIVATESWTPWALLALESAVGRSEEARDLRTRLRSFALFALAFGFQILAGFLQTAYFAGLVYAAWAAVAAAGWVVRRDAKQGLRLFALFGAACVVAVGIGAMGMLPTGEIARASPRESGVPWEFASGHPFWVPDLWTFLNPTANGNVADGTYIGRGIFWEDYAYAGLATVLLAPLGIAAGRRERRIVTLAAGALVALLLVLGPATPVFRFAFDFVPGMSRFRFPTRFLFVVELALAVLAARGITSIAQALERHGRARLGLVVGVLVAAATWGDLLVAQAPQNAFADASVWLERPDTVRYLQEQPAPFRIYTPFAQQLHRMAFAAAHGWADLEPYERLRDVIEPNTNQLWDLEAGSGYYVLAPKWVGDYWGDYGPSGAVVARERIAGERLDFRPSWLRLLALANVRYVVSHWDIETPRLELVKDGPVARIYRLAEALPRAYVATRARAAANEAEELAQLVADDFQPGTDVVLPTAGQAAGSGGPAEITARHENDVTVRTAGGGGWLVLAETWFPGWEATLDGRPVQVLRANMWQRAVALPAGEHEVRFAYDPPAARRGRWITLAALVLSALALVLTRPKRLA